MNWTFIAFNVVILMLSSYAVTWFFAIYLHLNYWTLFSLFSFLIFANVWLQSLLFPLKIINQLRNELSTVRIAGFAIFGFLTGVTNIGILAQRFNWLPALGLCIGVSFVGPAVFAAVWKSIQEIKEGKPKKKNLNR
jgi:hypothetical protein